MNEIAAAILEASKEISAAAPAFLPDLMTIRRPTSTKGPTGGNLPGAPQVLASNVPCKLRAPSGREIEIAGATQGGLVVVVKTPSWHSSGFLIVDSKCELLIAEGTQPAQTLKVIVQLPNSGPFTEILTTRAS